MWSIGHSFCKQCLHDLQFMKKGSSSPNLSKLARADISCQCMKTRSLCRPVYKMKGLQYKSKCRVQMPCHLRIFPQLLHQISGKQHFSQKTKFGRSTHILNSAIKTCRFLTKSIRIFLIFYFIEECQFKDMFFILTVF